jgi:hypothetical protein
LKVIGNFSFQVHPSEYSRWPIPGGLRPSAWLSKRDFAQNFVCMKYNKKRQLFLKRVAVAFFFFLHFFFCHSSKIGKKGLEEEKYAVHRVLLLALGERGIKYHFQ